MSVLVSGMKMPKYCGKCRLFGEYGCAIIGAVGYALTEHKRPDDCPLVELLPHGRLIDADALTERLERGENSSLGQAHAYYRFAKSWVKEAPTIVPAEGGSDHAEEV